MKYRDRWKVETDDKNEVRFRQTDSEDKSKNTQMREFGRMG